jgi:peptide/nickel transport system permease protein
MKNNNVNNKKISNRKDKLKRYWYRYSKNILSVLGLIFVILIVLMAIFAPYISPHKESAGTYISFSESNKPPSSRYLCGTDSFGRDILSRIIFGFRISLLLGIIVISLSAPVGIFVGLVAGYFRGRLISSVLMRIVDIFVSVPALLLALVVCSLLTPGIVSAMIAICIAWWSWYARIIYGVVSSIRGEFYVQVVEVSGGSTWHILFREILPNCLSTIFTKMSLDMGAVILIGSSISFVGLGAQPPTPDLGTMVAEGAKFLPNQWWVSIFPAIAIVFIVLAFNLMGDGVRDMLGTEGV